MVVLEDKDENVKKDAPRRRPRDWRPPWHAAARKKNPRAYELWSVEEEKQLAEEYSRLTLKKIAARHERTKMAVSLRFLDLGLVDDFQLIKRHQPPLEAKERML